MKRNDVIKTPFKVKKIDGIYRYHRYKVYNAETGETWRYFDSRRDAYEYAYFMNGNTGIYTRDKWY